MTVSGVLTIRLDTESNHSPVSVGMQRSHFLSRFFKGKSVSDATQTLPMLFNVCRRAQSVASVRCAERATERLVDKHVEQKRDKLVAIETLQEHLWNILIKLPSALNLNPMQTLMVTASQTLQKTMTELNANQHLTLYSVESEEQFIPDVQLDKKWINSVLTSIFGDTKPLTYAKLMSQSSFAGKLIQSCNDLNWLSSYQPAEIPTVESQQISSLLEADSPSSFINLLYCDKAIGETGCLIRQLNHPVVAEYASSHGIDLTARLLALLTEVHILLTDITDFNVQVCNQKFLPNTSLVSLETARGRLTQLWSCKANANNRTIIETLHLISPTDWNFDSSGIAKHLLNELIAKESTHIPIRAELLISLLNPCMQHNLLVNRKEVQHA